VRAFTFFGGVPALIVPDNLKAAVNIACRYEPELNPTYADLAAHYGTAVLPARPYKPKDKAKVEVGVQVVERWILARLRHHTFFLLADLNAAIRALLVELNNRPFKPWTDRRLNPCPPRLMNMQTGKRRASTSTTTSRSMGTITRCRTPM
jgi:transposase